MKGTHRPDWDGTYFMLGFIPEDYIVFWDKSQHGVQFALRAKKYNWLGLTLCWDLSQQQQPPDWSLWMVNRADPSQDSDNWNKVREWKKSNRAKARREEKKIVFARYSSNTLLPNSHNIHFFFVKYVSRRFLLIISQEVRRPKTFWEYFRDQWYTSTKLQRDQPNPEGLGTSHDRGWCGATRLYPYCQRGLITLIQYTLELALESIFPTNAASISGLRRASCEGIHCWDIWGRISKAVVWL